MTISELLPRLRKEDKEALYQAIEGHFSFTITYGVFYLSVNSTNFTNVTILEKKGVWILGRKRQGV